MCQCVIETGRGRAVIEELDSLYWKTSSETYMI